MVCVALVLGSYLLSGLVNASPVTQPTLAAPRMRGIVVTAPAPRSDRETPASEPHRELPQPEKRVQLL